MTTPIALKRIDSFTISEVNQRADIVDVVAEHVALEKRGKDYMGLCPFHDEKTPSFSVSPTKGLAYCFGCSWGGNAIKFLMELNKTSFRDTVLALARDYGIRVRYEDGTTNDDPLPPLRQRRPLPLPERAKRTQEPKKDYTVNGKRVRESVNRLLHGKSEPQRKALSWLQNRGITRSIIEHYRLGLEKQVVIPNGKPNEKQEFWAIAIFIPVPDKPGRFFVKRRIAPWLVGEERPDYLAPWSQRGVPPVVWLTNNPDNATETFFAEGEWDAIALGWLAFQQKCSVAIACSTAGAGTVPPEQELARLPGDVKIFYDQDQPGENGAVKLAQALGERAKIALVPMPDDCSVKGWDISDALASGYTWEDFEAAAALSEQPKPEGEPPLPNDSSFDANLEIPDSFNPTTEFIQKALEFLYGDKPWICVNGNLHYWTGTHYKNSLDGAELRRIRNFCNGYAVVDKHGNMRYPFATPSKVREVLNWIKISFWVDPKEVNPAGLNCTNGVLQLTWEGLPPYQKPTWKLYDHTPELYYTYEPVVTYNPDADSTNCDRMLECLDAPQREIFLRSIAASLDLATIRANKGRLVRGLLLKGHGSNGKDTLRECVAAMYGYQGITGCTFSDFKAYDNGRKFPLARLVHSRVNWATENANTAKLDDLQSVKAFLTGDILSHEGKGKDEYDFTAKGIGLFNVNDTPNMQAAMEAIKSRWGVLVFNKTYKIGADPTKGEIEADPRFKYDPTFLHQNVLPAFLNRVLAALVDLMEKDINYDCTEEALKAIQAENSHLFQFCQDTGLRYDPNSTLTAGEIWQALEQWYIDNGTLSYEEGANGKQKSIWTEQARKGDANVKGANQVIPRFQALFPKTKRVTVGKGKMALQGISFAPPPGDGEPVEAVGEAMVSQLVSQKPLIYKDGEPVTPVSHIGQENETQLETNEVNHAASALHEANGCEKLPRLAHHSDIASEKASPTASPTASPDAQTASPAPSISAEELAEMLLVCDCAEAVAELRSVLGVTPELLNKACKRLSQKKHAQIKVWVIELNSRLKVGDRVFVNSCPHTDRLGPYPIEWINVDAGIAKLEGFASPIALVDLRKATE